MASDLTKKLLKASGKGSIASTMKESEFSKIDYYVSSDSIMANLLMSAKWNGGVPAGRVSMLAGPKSHGKTQLAMNYAKKFQKMGGTIILIDAEFASENEAMENLGIDTENVIYLPLSHIKDDEKELSITFQLNEILKDIERGEKVMIIIDSLGALQTKGTLQNIEKNNTAMDMKVAAEKKGFMSFLTSIVGQKGIPCLVLNHSYEAVGSFTGGQEVSGGGALYYPSTILLMGSKAQMKIDEETCGTLLRTVVYKGRISREKAVGKWAMHYEHGILDSFGLDEFAIEGGYIEETKDGRSTVYKYKEHTCPKKTYMLPENNDFWYTVLKETDFGSYLNDIFSYGSNKKCNSLEILPE